MDEIGSVVSVYGTGEVLGTYRQSHLAEVSLKDLSEPIHEGMRFTVHYHQPNESGATPQIVTAVMGWIVYRWKGGEVGKGVHFPNTASSGDVVKVVFHCVTGLFIARKGPHLREIEFWIRDRVEVEPDVWEYREPRKFASGILIYAGIPTFQQGGVILNNRRG